MVWAKKKSTSPAPKVHQKVPQGTYFIDFYIGFFLNLNKSSLKKNPLKNFLMNFLGWPGPRKKFRHPQEGKHITVKLGPPRGQLPSKAVKNENLETGPQKVQQWKKYYLETWAPPPGQLPSKAVKNKNWKLDHKKCSNEKILPWNLGLHQASSQAKQPKWKLGNWTTKNEVAQKLFFNLASHRPGWWQPTVKIQ